MPKSGIAMAMEFFGKLPNQRITEFRDEWNSLSDKDKEEITNGLADGSHTY